MKPPGCWSFIVQSMNAEGKIPFYIQFKFIRPKIRLSNVGDSTNF